MAAKKTTKKSTKTTKKSAAKKTTKKTAKKATKKTAKKAGKKATKKAAAPARKATKKAAAKAPARPSARRSDAPAPAEPQAAAPAKTKKKGAVSAAEINLGHIITLKPRVNTSFKPDDLRAAKQALEEEGYANVQEAARAVAEKALELNRQKPGKHGFRG